MSDRVDLECESASQLAARVRQSAARSEPFDADVALELARRAETGELLQAQVRSDALRAIAPAGGYVAGDF